MKYTLKKEVQKYFLSYYQFPIELEQWEKWGFTKEALEEVKPELPTSWEEFCETQDEGYSNRFIKRYGNIPNRFIALAQLEALRNVYNDGWKADWTTNMETKYCIEFYNEKIEIYLYGFNQNFLHFKTQKLAEQFLENFEDLIIEAKELM